MKQTELDPLVEEIVRDSIKPSITVTIRGIIEEVKKRKGVEPSLSQVKYSLNRLGINTQNNTKKWVWRHNPPKGE